MIAITLAGNLVFVYSRFSLFGAQIYLYIFVTSRPYMKPHTRGNNRLCWPHRFDRSQRHRTNNAQEPQAAHATTVSECHHHKPHRPRETPRAEYTIHISAWPTNVHHFHSLLVQLHYLSNYSIPHYKWMCTDFHVRTSNCQIILLL